MYLSLSLYACAYIYMRVYIYIYMHREREREVYAYMYVCIYIYIYTCEYMNISIYCTLGVVFVKCTSSTALLCATFTSSLWASCQAPEHIPACKLPEMYISGRPARRPKRATEMISFWAPCKAPRGSKEICKHGARDCGKQRMLRQKKSS